MDHSTKLEDLTEQSPKDIYRHGVDEQLCISGRIKMSWNLPGGTEALVVIPPSGVNHEEHSFKISFEIGKKYLQMLDFAPHDQFRLSLRGANVQKLKDIPRLSTLPLRLVFTQGVHISWRRQGSDEAAKAVNTWSFNNKVESNLQSSDSWFYSQEEQDGKSKGSGMKRTQSEVGLANNEKENKKQRRVVAKQEKRNLAAHSKTSAHDIIDSRGANPTNPQQQDLPAITVTQNHNPPDTISPPPDNQGTDLFKIPRNPIQSSDDVCTQLKDVQKGQMTTIIGVVVAMSDPKRTGKGDWMRFVDIVDQSIHNTRGSGFKINCFTPRHKEWLPHPEEGDILILRNVKIVNHNGGLSAVGYGNRLQWAAFSPIKGEFHHGPPNSAPKKEGLADAGFGVQFTPFVKPGQLQTMHCVKLSDWWRGISAPSRPKLLGSNRRVHRLISETGPTVYPDGYFDCTIEVLNGFQNSNNMVYTLYVTDYTRNDQMRGVQSNWCPATLSEFVIQFEMWDEAAVLAEKMRPGQYYSIQNARMMANASGYPEGKVRENKIVLLAEDDAVSNPYLRDLLERKRKWEEKQRNAESDIKYQLIQNVQEGRFFHCTVELLRVVSQSNQRCYIYVTDYTSHAHLSSASLPGLQALQGRIVKIILSEEQQSLASNVSAGEYYAIKKLRLKYSSTEGCFCGILGGNEKLVIKLNPNKTENEHLNGLLRRRENWLRNSGQVQLNARELEQQVPTNSGDKSLTFMSIKDVCSPDITSSTHQITARPVDFYPLDLEDAFYQWCSHCNVEIPNAAKACFKCSDFDHEHVQYRYQLYILLQDESEDEVIVSVDDKCSLFKGLKRACLREDRLALKLFHERVNPLLGQLTMVHNGLKVGKKIDVYDPLYHFYIEGWPVSENRRAFRLIKYNSLDS